MLRREESWGSTRVGRGNTGSLLRQHEAVGWCSCWTLGTLELTLGGTFNRDPYHNQLSHSFIVYLKIAAAITTPLWCNTLVHYSGIMIISRSNTLLHYRSVMIIGRSNTLVHYRGVMIISRSNTLLHYRGVMVISCSNTLVPCHRVPENPNTTSLNSRVVVWTLPKYSPVAKPFVVGYMRWLLAVIKPKNIHWK